MNINDKIEIIRKLKIYNGKNPYILALKRDACSGRNENSLNDFAIEYIQKNFETEPKIINKTIKIADWYGNKMKEKYNLDFIPEKILIQIYLGETDTNFHCYIKYRQNMKPILIFIPKKAVLGNFLLEDYNNFQVDFDRYDKLSMSKDINRKLKEHQKAGVKFLLSRKKCILADDMGLGKLEPVSAMIPTPNGYKRMGDIIPGNFVFGRDGKQHKVLQVFPHKDKEIYKVTFSDNTSCECGLDHLWMVRDKNMARAKKEWKVLSLGQMLKMGLQYNNSPKRIKQGLKPVNKFEIPICEAVEYGEKEFNVQPYELGAMIDDSNTGENNNFIPVEYKFSSIQQRIELLRGLMDSNGTIGKDGNRIYYSTKSKQLAEDIAELIFSLGGIAKIHLYNSTEHGENTKYKVSIQIKINPFKLKKKAERYKPTFKKHYTKHILSAEYVRNEDAQCILVDYDDHTYLTGKNYIVTHNTTTLSVASIEGNFDHVLIICPASLKTNWKNELMWYIPEKQISIIEGFVGKTKTELEEYLGYGIGKSGKKINELLEEARERGKWDENRYVIVNFDILNNFYQLPESRSREDIQKSEENSILLQYIKNHKSLIIVDEAHRLSNTNSEQYKIIKNLIKRGKPDSLYLATGTPITNNPQNYLNLLQLVGDDISNDWNYYMERYCGAIKIPKNKEEKEKRNKITQNYLSSHGISSWFLLTDEQKQELNELIDKNCKMMLIYKDATNLDELKLRTSHIYLRRTKDDLTDLPNKRIHEMVYNLPNDKMNEYSKLWEEYENSQLSLDPDKELNKELLEGAIYRKFCSNEMIPYTIKLAENFIKNNEKIVIVCCYDEELYTLRDYYGDKCIVYNGKMSLKEKDKAIESFKNDDNKKVFIGNIIAAGVGINLVCSHVIIFNNFSFVTGDCRQMEDRCYRIGQANDVDIYYQFFKDTQYEKMWNIVLKKQLIIDSVIKKEDEK